MKSGELMIAAGWVVLGAACLLVVGCMVALAPGADQVKMTKNPQDVTSCQAVGNVKVPTSDGNVDIVNAAREFRNQVVGHGGNTGLVTFGPVGAPSQGIAYKCS